MEVWGLELEGFTSKMKKNEKPSAVPKSNHFFAVVHLAVHTIIFNLE